MKIKKHSTKVWVEIEVNKYTDGLTVLRGRLLQEDLSAWAAGDLAEGALKLENTHWYADNIMCYLGKGDSASTQYTGETYVRVDTIMTILVLRSEHFLKSNELDSAQILNNILLFPGRLRAKIEH